jgi:putative colanic acid biosynthesis acetyltransferase WcaF
MTSPPPPSIEVYVNRLPVRNRLGRALWTVVCTMLFRPSPRLCFGWRNLLLRAFGATLGSGVKIHPRCRIWAPWNLRMGSDSSLSYDVDCYNVAAVVIGDHVSVSQYAFLCTASHDLSDPQRRLIAKPIAIGDQAWVFARAFVGPGVSIGVGGVAAACAVVVRDVEPWTIVGGNPATIIKQRELRS